jgi:rubrerythrin
MTKSDTHIQLQRWIGAHPEILEVRKGKEVQKKVLDELGLLVGIRELFDLIHPDRVYGCVNARFVGWAVGYCCSKNCDCYRQRVAASVKKTKQQYSPEQRNAIQQKRIQTVQDRYGESNVFQIEAVRIKSEETKQQKYNDPHYRNDSKLKQTNLSRYGVENPAQSDQVQAKIKQTNQERYGVENPAQSDQVQAKIKQTNLSRYGVENPAQSDQVQAKIKQTNQERYGVDNPAQSAQVQQRISAALRKLHLPKHEQKYRVVLQDTQYTAGLMNTWMCSVCGDTFKGKPVNGSFTQCLVCNPYWTSKPEIELGNFITSLGFTVERRRRDVIAPKELDIFVPEKNIAFEMCGLYYHSEWYGKYQRYHYSKFQQCRDNGIRLITIFDDIWYSHTELVKSRISSILGVNSQRVPGRKCHVVEISDSQARAFLNQNHLQGWCASKYRMGLYTGDQLVAVMTLGKSRFDHSDYELLRYCSVMGISVTGGASKLFSHFVKVHAPRSVTTFSDNCWGSTAFYQNLGFQKIGETTPGYWYISASNNALQLPMRGHRINRHQAQKHKLATRVPELQHLSENEIMNQYGYARVWDCGNEKWRWLAHPKS